MILCTNCGHHNDPGTDFCSSCGWFLEWVGKPVAEVDGGPRASEPGPATPGPTAPQKEPKKPKKSRRRPGKRTLAAAGIAAAVAAVAATAAALNWDRIVPSFVTVRPARVEASSSLAAHPPAHATDLVTNTYWAEAARGDGVGEDLTLTLPSPTDVDRVIVTLTDAARKPRQLRVLLDDATRQTALRLADTTEPQAIDLEGATGVEQLRFVIVDIHDGDGNDVAIAEIELRRRR